MKVFFFNKKSIAWMVALAVIIVIAILLLASNRAEPTGIVGEYIMGLL